MLNLFVLYFFLCYIQISIKSFGGRFMNIFNLLGGIFNVKKADFGKGFEWLFPIVEFLDKLIIFWCTVSFFSCQMRLIYRYFSLN